MSYRAFGVFSTQTLRWTFPALICLTTAYPDTGHADVQADVNTLASGSDLPQRKLNPNPKQAYEIRFTLADVSDLSMLAGDKAPFAVIEGIAQFDVGNAALCGHAGGAANRASPLSSQEPFRLARISASEYVGTVYADLLLDEDYYGYGPCHWTLTEARVVLRARTDSTDTRFVSFLQVRRMFADGVQLRYFWKGYYPRFEEGKYADYGRENLISAPAGRRNEFFTTTFAVRKIAP